MRKLLFSSGISACVAAAALIPLSASAATPETGVFVISDTTLMGCHAAGTLNAGGSIITAGGCAVLPDSAPGGGVQVFTGGTWSGNRKAGVTVCFTFRTVSGPQYPTPFCVGPLPVNTGPEVIPDPGGGTGTTLIDVTLG